MAVKNIQIKSRRLPTLAKIGLATHWFPHYTNDKLITHRLDVVLLSFIIRGSGEHLIDDRRYPVQGPSIGITHLDQTHCILSGAEPLDIMNIYLDLERLRLPELPEPLQEMVTRLLPLNARFVDRLNRVQQLDLPPDSVLPEVAQWLNRELTRQPLGWEGMVAGYWQVFFTELCRTACSTGLKAPPHPHPSGGRLEKVRTFMDQNFKEPLTLAQLAAVAGLSPTYLCRAFRAYAGKSLFTYILERRIQAAMLRLRQTDEKVIRIAHEVGFNDLSHFNRCFTRLCGHSPRAYRLHAFQGGDAGTTPGRENPL